MRYKLKQVCDFYAGTGFPVVYQGEDSGDLPFYKVGDIAANVAAGNDCLSFCNNYISYDVAKEIKGSILPKDVVVFAKIGEALKLNRRAITSCNCLIDNNAMGIAAKPSVLNVRYFFYFMKSVKMEEHSESTTVPSVRKSKLENIEITVPNMQEQHQMAAILDKLQSIITHRKQQLAKLDELVKARFVEMFGDGESPLINVENMCSDIVDCPHTTPKYEGELKNPAIRTSEIKKGYITWDSMKYVSDEEYLERISRLRPEAGDIVYGREGTFGNAAILPEGYRFCLGQRVMLLRPDYNKCTSEYLLHAVISDDVYRQAVEKNNASTVAHVNVKDVKQFVIPLPSFDKQNQFTRFLKQIDKSKFMCQSIF